MKNLRKIVLATSLVASALVAVSCDNKSKKVEEVVDEVSMELPNNSDVAFQKAVTALNNTEYKSAGEYIDQGVNALKVEAKSKGSTIFKNSLDTNIKHLADIAEQLKKGEKVNEDALRNMMANAEINVAHDYLVTDDTYILTEPEKVNDSKLQKALDHNLKGLKEGTDKLKGDAKKQGEKLKTEGEKLKEEYASWRKRANEHAKETEAYFYEYQPEFVYPMGVFYLF